VFVAVVSDVAKMEFLRTSGYVHRPARQGYRRQSACEPLEDVSSETEVSSSAIREIHHDEHPRPSTSGAFPETSSWSRTNRCSR